MSHLAIVCRVCAFLLLLGVVPACADELSLLDVLDGKVAPLTVRVKELTADWRKLIITGQEEDPQQLAILGNGALTGARIGVYYTTGQVLDIHGERFLVAYAEPFSSIDIQAVIRRTEKPQPLAPLSPNTTLVLSLLSTNAISALHEITPFTQDQTLNLNAQRQQAQEAAEQKTRQNESFNNLRQIGAAVQMWAHDHGEKFPPLDNPDVWAEFKLEDKVTQHPLTHQPYKLNAHLAGKPLANVFDPKEVIVAFEVTPWPDGQRTAVFADGHVAMHAAEEWTELMELSDANMERPADPKYSQLDRFERISMDNLRQVVLGVQMWVQDNDEMFPPLNVADMIDHLNLDKKVTRHPVTKQPYRFNISLSSKALGEIENPEQMVLAFEAAPWPDGRRAVGFVDGHVAMLTQPQWLKAKMRSGIN